MHVSTQITILQQNRSRAHASITCMYIHVCVSTCTCTHVLVCAMTDDGPHSFMKLHLFSSLAIYSSSKKNLVTLTLLAVRAAVYCVEMEWRSCCSLPDYNNNVSVMKRQSDKMDIIYSGEIFTSLTHIQQFTYHPHSLSLPPSASLPLSPSLSLPLPPPGVFPATHSDHWSV